MGLQVEIQKLLDIISFLLIKLGKDHAESNITELNDILIKSRADILKIQSNVSDVDDGFNSPNYESEAGSFLDPDSGLLNDFTEEDEDDVKVNVDVALLDDKSPIEHSEVINDAEPVTITFKKELIEPDNTVRSKSKKIPQTSKRFKQYEICLLCNAQIQPNHVENHLKEKHQDIEDRYLCPDPECDFKSQDLKIVAKHSQSHRARSSYLCPHCPTYFELPSLLKLHLKEIHNESFDQNTCPICHLQFSSYKNELFLHMVNNHDCSIHKCKICDKTFNNIRTYRHHMNKNHNNVQTFTCDECGFSTIHSYSLKLHLESHNLTKESIKNYPCPDCEKTFKSSKRLYAHNRLVHQMQNILMCSECDYTCKTKSNLRTHMTRHSDERPFSCSYCDLKFKTNHTRNKHMKVSHTHSQERNHICKHCGKGFKHSANLSTHVKIHTGENWSHCDICKKSFVQKYNYKIHMMKSHQIRV